ncbi:MAG: cytochrome c oxidase subunit II [Pseudomonadota bacterium]
MKTAMLAAGLMLAGVAHAAPQDAPAAAKPATTAAAPAAAATPAPASKPADPLLEMDGAPKLAPTAGIGQSVDGAIGIQPQVTKNGERAERMHNYILLPLIVAISIFVLFLLLWVIFRYRASANPVASKTAHNTWLEVAWTLIPVLILVAIAVPSIGLLQAQFKPPPKDAITLKVTGNQWYWSYSYPDNGDFEIVSNLLKEKDEVSGDERARTDADGPRLLAVDNRVVLPVGVPIRLITTSADVIHSWAVPAFWIKLDAVPGRINETSFTIEKPGLYFGQCSELCGPKHGYMPIAVQAVPLDVYNRWVVAKGGKVAGTAPAPTAPATEIATDNAIDADNAAADNSTGQ